MKIKVLLAAGLFIGLSTHAQEDTLAKGLDEVIVYANKFAEKRKNLAQKIEVITSRFISRMNAQNTGDLLVSTGNVFVQKSQQGGSSPVIRGFEASRVLLVVDGIRLNNAVYRAGHLQNIITVDQNMLERVEVLYGPASTIYGSDALGGVVHMRTKNPVFSTGEKLLVRNLFFTRYSSANQEKSIHYDVSVGGRKFGWLQGYNFSSFGDMKMGDNYRAPYPDFGRRSQYIETRDGQDIIVSNRDDRVQKFSGYDQWDILQKFVYQPTQNFQHLLNFQYSNSTNIPRYDRLQDIRNGLLRYAEWFYGPQKRLMAAYELNVTDLAIAKEIKVLISYQDIAESRNQREFQRYDAFDSRKENIKVWGFNADARKFFRNHELTIGLDGQLNKVRSRASRSNLLNGEESPLDSRYPNGKNRMNYFAVYAQHLLKLNDDKIILNDGLRLQFVNLHSTITDNSFFNLPFTEIKQDNLAVTGNLGAVYMPKKDLRIALNLATGFRAPNIDDLARIFESSTSERRVIFPNPDIKPEYTYNIDLGISQLVGEKIKLELAAFYTWFHNAIVLSPFPLNGQDSINYNGTMSAVFANQNKRKAFIAGVNSALNIELFEGLRLFSTITYTYGRFKQEDGSKAPLDHIPPVYGKTSLGYSRARLNAEAYVMYNGWKRLVDYNDEGEDNLQYATPDGMPSWMTANFKLGYDISGAFTVQAGIENIFDRNYRYFASGFSAAGRNIMVALRAHF